MSDFAQSLIAARRSGLPVEGPVPPLTLDRGYGIAAQLWAALGTPAGWKIGATNARGQAFLGIAEPICGRIFAEGLLQDGDIVPGPGARLEAEPEILFRLGEGGAIAAAHLGIEIVRPSSLTPFDHGVGFIVADNAAHVALAIGPEIDMALLERPEAIEVMFGPHQGSAAGVMGDPRHALAWLAARQPLGPGDWIASGAMTPALPFDGDVVADFGAFGQVRVAAPAKSYGA